jgi:hypothetical protein
MTKLYSLLLKYILVGIVAFAFLPIDVRADSGPAHEVDQPFPVQLGTSGGNINDISKGFCYGGTLGALVEDASNQYILSNNHVLARTNAATTGEDIIQPGLIDQSPACFKDTTDIVADLSWSIPIQFKAKNTIPTNTVDAAIAQVRVGNVDPMGSIIDIGTLSSDTVAPSLNMAVKKSGRSTGLTNGNITAVNATIDVSYGKGKTARFTDQIVVGSSGFIAAGDSGSLMVEDVDTNPRAVGLLFAGSSTTAIANPIGDVLNAFRDNGFNVSMVGSGPSTSLLGKILAWARKFLSVAESQAANAHLPPQVSQAAVDAVTKVKERHEGKILATPGVVGVGVGVSEKAMAQAAVEIYVTQATESLRQALPNSLDNVEVKIVETGEIHAY